jgi:hypothetical protein
MFETITTATISVASVLLFAYWFRYTCLLILSTKSALDYSEAIVTQHNLGFGQVQIALQTTQNEIPRHLQDALDRDYATLQGLLKRAGNVSLESRMISAHYQIMRAWLRVSSAYSPAAARRALDEMAQAVAHLANGLGEYAAAPSAA